MLASETFVLLERARRNSEIGIDKLRGEKSVSRFLIAFVFFPGISRNQLIFASCAQLSHSPCGERRRAWIHPSRALGGSLSTRRADRAWLQQVSIAGPLAWKIPLR